MPQATIRADPSTRPQRESAPMNRALRTHRTKLIMITPAVLVIAALIAFPIIYTVQLSFTEGLGSGRPFGLDNYRAVLSDTGRFWPAVWRTVVFTVGALVLQLVLGIGTALLLRRPFRGHNAVKTILILPLVTSPVAVASIWLLMLEPNLGIVNEALGWFGIAPQGWLKDPSQAFPTLILLDVWQFTPLIVLITLAGLSGLPEEVEEAAVVDGANYLQRTRHVTLPLLRNTIVVAAVLRGVDAMKTFDIIYATVGPGGGGGHTAETLNVYVYGLSFDYIEIGKAAVALVAFFIMVLAVALLIIRRAARE